MQSLWRGIQYAPFQMLLIAQSIERLVVAQEVTSLSLVEEPILLRLPPEASGSLSAAVPLPHDKGFPPKSAGRRVGKEEARHAQFRRPLEEARVFWP